MQSALGVALSGDEVYLAGGRYTPAPTGGSQAVGFVLAMDLTLYGGFRGGEASPGERPAFGIAPTRLSGDLSGDDMPNGGNREDNGGNVIRSSSSSSGFTDATTVLFR